MCYYVYFSYRLIPKFKIYILLFFCILFFIVKYFYCSIFHKSIFKLITKCLQGTICCSTICCIHSFGIHSKPGNLLLLDFMQGKVEHWYSFGECSARFAPLITYISPRHQSGNNNEQ
jgi:hypothetical protein